MVWIKTAFGINSLQLHMLRRTQKVLIYWLQLFEIMAKKLSWHPQHSKIFRKHSSLLNKTLQSKTKREREKEEKETICINSNERKLKFLRHFLPPRNIFTNIKTFRRHQCLANLKAHLLGYLEIPDLCIYNY